VGDLMQQITHILYTFELCAIFSKLSC